MLGLPALPHDFLERVLTLTERAVDNQARAAAALERIAAAAEGVDAG